MENKPTFNIIVSICLAAYNGDKYIRHAIDSVLNQSRTDFELIISDDGSSDETEAICRTYSYDSRVRYIRHEHNRGGFWNNNFLLMKARGLYVTFLSQDDAMEKEFLMKTTAYLNKHPECILVSGDFKIIDENGQTKRIACLDKIRESTDWKKRSYEFFRDPRSNVPLCIYGLMRIGPLRETYAEMPWPQKLVKASELPFLCRVAVRGQIVSLPLILRQYRKHSQSTYQQEKVKLAAKPYWTRKVMLLENLYRLRFDQLRVLLGSNYAWTTKLFIIWSAYWCYAGSFLLRLINLPKKLYLKIYKHE